MAKITPWVVHQFFDDDGNPLSGGKVHTYEAGTTTPKQTFTDSSEDTPNTNPIILDSAGRCSLWLGDGAYDYVIKDSNDATIDTQDNEIGNNTLGFNGSVEEISSNLTLTEAYQNSFIVGTSTVSVNLLAAADAGEGFTFSVYAQSGTLTVDPDGSELINGGATIVLSAGEGAIITCTGTVWRAIVTSVFTLDDESVTNAKLVHVDTATFKGRTTAGTGDVEDLTVAQARTLLDVYTQSEVDAAIAANTPTLITEIDLTASSGSSPKTILSGVSGLTRIAVNITGLSLSGTDTVLLQLSTSSTYKTTGYDSQATLFGTGVQHADNPTGFIIYTLSAADSVNGQVILEKGEGDVWSYSIVAHRLTSSSIIASGTVDLAGDLDGIRFITSGSDTFDAGTVTGNYS